MLFTKKIKIPVEISARHIHLSQKDLEVLFGTGYQLTKKVNLTQLSDFACEETITIKSNSNVLENIRIVGPLREQTQVEISLTDAKKLQVNPPIRLSGDLKNSCGVKLVGPAGQLELMEGLIIAKNHIHCATEEAKRLKLKNGQEVSVKIFGERPITFHNVRVRIKDDYKLCLHLDTDEGNAAGINKVGEGFIL